MVPLEYTFIRVSGSGVASTNPTHVGFLRFPYWIQSRNPLEVNMQHGFNIYLRPVTPGSLMPVAQWDSGPDYLRPGWCVGPAFPSHAVTLTEISAGRSVNYTVHLWHQILNPGPLHRQDRWVNFTFLPLPEQTYYSEGRDQESEACST